MLYIVATPIGNLKDITLRALEVLKSADCVICEDTRRTGLLLNHYQIKKPLLVLNDYNEAKKVPYFVNKLLSGKNIALVSDAGTPLVADPGYKLVRECFNKKIPLESIPGPSAVTASLSIAGLPTDKFCFLGYLPEKGGPRIKILQKLKEITTILSQTYIFFVAPHKIINTLKDIMLIFGDINLILVHELTKVHQTRQSFLISEWINKLEKQPPKGEWTALFRPD